MNLTNGALADDVVRRWIVADLRRGNGDAWAANHLRIDIVNAGVLGPPGLNGTDRSIERHRAAGALEVQCQRGQIAAAGVIAVAKETQTQMPWAGLTDFVIVQVYESTGEPCTRVMTDGTSQPLSVRRTKGALGWQLDTGEFRDDPVIGPLWYQARGWSCAMDGSGELDRICGLVQPGPPVPTTSAQARNP